MRLTINGVEREFADLQPGAVVSALVASLGFRPDRVALEQNGAIVPRARWGETSVQDGDRVELVHFVGGGVASQAVSSRGDEPVAACSRSSHCRP